MILAMGVDEMLSTFWAQMIYDICGLGLSEVANWVDNLVSYDDMWNKISGFADSIKVVASVWLLVHFLCFILEQSTKEQLTMDTFFKGFLKFVIGFFFVQNCIPIFNLLMELGNIMQTGLSPSALGIETGGTVTVAEIQEALEDFRGTDYPDSSDIMQILNYIGDFCEWIVDVLLGMGTTLLFWLIALVVNVVIAIMLAIRILELAVRALFAPIAVVDVFEHGTSGNGFKYMKKFLAVAIQGAVIMAVMSCILNISGLNVTDAEILVDQTVLSTTNLGDGTFTEVVPNLLKNAVFKIAGLGLIMKSQPICNDIIGV